MNKNLKKQLYEKVVLSEKVVHDTIESIKRDSHKKMHLRKYNINRKERRKMKRNMLKLLKRNKLIAEL